MTLEGYDISHWQATTPDLTGIDFVICRATYGTNPDDMYKVHAANVRAQGKVLGAYHFARPATLAGQSVEAQVQAFLDAAPDADFWVIDREKDSDNGTITLTATRAFIALVHATGRRIGLYSSESAFRDAGQDFNWVARWGGPEPTIPWDIWQWEGGGTDKLDNDKFRGTRGALVALGAPLEAFVDAQVAALNAAIETKNQQINQLAETISLMSAEATAMETKISSATLLLENGTENRARAILVGETA
jgi:hypothetical protein